MKTHCTACSRFGPDCKLEFKCYCCGEVKNVCGHRVGGFTGYEDVCDHCHLWLKTGHVVYKTGGSSYSTRPGRIHMTTDLPTTKGSV